MLLALTLFLFLLDISAMATPLLSRRHELRARALPDTQKFSLGYVNKFDKENQRHLAEKYSGLWMTVNITPLTPPHMNLICYLTGVS